MHRKTVRMPPSHHTAAHVQTNTRKPHRNVRRCSVLQGPTEAWRTIRRGHIGAALTTLPRQSQPVMFLPLLPLRIKFNPMSYAECLQFTLSLCENRLSSLVSILVQLFYIQYSAIDSISVLEASVVKVFECKRAVTLSCGSCFHWGHGQTQRRRHCWFCQVIHSFQQLTQSLCWRAGMIPHDKLWLQPSVQLSPLPLRLFCLHHHSAHLRPLWPALCSICLSHIVSNKCEYLWAVVGKQCK